MDVRVDTYLWAIRLFKTRSQASEAIKGKKVKLNGEPLKAAHKIRIGEVYTFRAGKIRKTIEVLSLTDKRLGFELASKHYKDLSPLPENTDEHKYSTQKMTVKRSRGAGRPSKKERRDLKDLDFF